MKLKLLLTLGMFSAQIAGATGNSSSGGGEQSPQGKSISAIFAALSSPDLNAALQFQPVTKVVVKEYEMGGRVVVSSENCNVEVRLSVMVGESEGMEYVPTVVSTKCKTP